MTSFPRWMKTTLAIFLFCLMAGGIWFYKTQEHQQKNLIQNNLYSIAQLKANQIADWRRERLADADVLMDNPVILQDISQWMKNPQPNIIKDIHTHLLTIQKRFKYDDVLLVTPEGRVAKSLIGTADKLPGDVQDSLTSAWQSHQPVLSKLHRNSDKSTPQTSVIAPFFNSKANQVGALILVSHADKYLYPLILSWPIPSETAETLLVARDGDSILFLNQLRHTPDAAFKLRIPLSQKDVPAVMAVLGQTGIVEGKDYRGVNVISAILPVPNSPWFIVAKMDKREAFAVWRFRSILILSLIFGLIFLALATVLLIWQRGEKAHYRTQYLAEAALRTAEKRHSVTLHSIGDAVIATDARSHVAILNPAAERLTGWTSNEALGRPIQDIFHIINETTGIAVENPVSKVLTEGCMVGLANQTLLISRDGVRRAIDGSGAPVRDEDGSLTGVVLVFRDRTQAQKVQRELEQANERLELAQGAAGIGVWDWDQKAQTIRWTSQMYDIFGLDESLPVPVRETWISMIHEDDRSYVIDHMREATRTKTKVAVEYRIRRPDGAVRAISVSGKVIYEGEEPLRILGICLDVTERKRAEEQIYLSVRKWQSTFDSIKDPVALLDENCLILQCNRSFMALLCKDSGEIIGQRCFEMMHGRESNIEDCPFIRSKNSLAREAMELQIVDRIYNVIVDPIIDRHHQFTGAVHILQDITERKQMEEALRESEEKYRILFDAGTQGILVADIETKHFIFANKSICSLFGYSLDELLELSLSDIHTENDMERVAHEFEALATGLKNLSTEIPCLRKDGSIFYADISATPITIAGHRCNLGFFIDVTERKNAEAEKEKLQAQLVQAQKMESVGRLAGGVAHDFNNMLSVILGYSELAIGKVASNTQVAEHLKIIQKTAQRSADLTRQLLAFARKQTIAPKVLDLNDTVAGMLKMLHRLIGEDINLAWQPGANLWPVLIDPSQVDQLLANLCVNARDAISAVGKITIETQNIHFNQAFCDCHTDYLPGDYVLLAVGDDGAGMDKTILNHLFEPFFTTKDIGQGTGLGLATVYGIVKQNAGFIDVHSEPDSGAVFKIYLPRHQGESTQEQADTEAEKVDCGQGVILLVEDEPTLLHMGRLMLEKLGYNVLTANSPGEAIQMAKQHAGKIDLLITDVVMPEMNGRELACLLVSLYPTMKQLFMSGYTANVIAHRGILDEGIEFIQKPFSIKELSAKVKDVLAK